MDLKEGSRMSGYDSEQELVVMMKAGGETGDLHLTSRGPQGLGLDTDAEADDALHITTTDTDIKDIIAQENGARGEGGCCPVNHRIQAPPCHYTLQAGRVLRYSKMNWLLLAMPLALISKLAGFGHGPTFLLSMIALIPQAQLLGLFTEQVALYTNDAIGGLLNATFGNLTELIISIIALEKNLIRIVQVSLLGSILSNCLLVLGSAFLLGGIRHKVQKFNTQMATTNSGLLMITTLALLLPAALNASEVQTSTEGVLGLSRFTALLLLCVYCLLLLFQIKTHKHLLDHPDDDEEEEQEIPILSLKEAIIWLAIDTVLISVFSEILVSAIEGASEEWKTPKIFIGVIIIPIVGNAAEHASAILVAWKGKMELSIGIAIGSAVQIALLGVPVAVIAAWCMEKDLSLDFRVFETAAVMVSVLAVGFVIADGESNWLKGVILIAAYLIVAGAFFVHKDDE